MRLQDEVERKLSGRMALASRAFLGLAVAAAIGVIAALAYTQRWFTPTVALYFYTDTASGLSRGMAVKLAGFNVGALDQVSLVGELRIKGKLVMERRYRDSVGKDARVRLSRDGLLGTYALLLIPGLGDAGPVDDGSTLNFEREPDYSTLASGLLERAGPVIDDLRAITATLSDAETGLPATVRELNDAAASLRDMGKSVSALAADGSQLTREVPARLAPALTAIEKDLAQIETLTKELNVSVPATLAELRASLRSARQATDAAQRLLAEDAPRVLRRTEEVVDNADEVIGAVRRSWPVKNMVPGAGGKVIELDSADGAGQAPARAP